MGVKTPAVGDIRQVIVALSETEPLIQDLVNYRFNTTSDLNGHTVGNLLLTVISNLAIANYHVAGIGVDNDETLLGIAAAKLGAGNVVAYDIDDWSVNNARHNAEINAIGNISVYHGDSNVLNHISGVFDIVMANINRNILLNDMPTFKSVMTTGSLLILSGFYQSDIPVLLDKAKELGLEEYGRKQDGEWACLVLLLNQ